MNPRFQIMLPVIIMQADNSQRSTRILWKKAGLITAADDVSKLVSSDGTRLLTTRQMISLHFELSSCWAEQGRIRWRSLGNQNIV